ncbi:MAG: glycosyltransferase [Deltaproteobacteria bacterium]|nr:glycosyltransferase [Deltaproteobacteria bacterium]
MIHLEPIRILRIIARLNIGGPAIQAALLTEALSKGPYRTLLVCGKVGVHEGDMSYLATSKGIGRRVLSGLGREISLLDDFRSFLHLRRVIKDFNPHIIHTHTAKAGTLGRIAGMSLNLLRGRKRRIRLVHTFHGHVFSGYFSPMKTLIFIWIERCLSKFTDRIVVISPLQRFDICERYRIAHAHRVQVIPLGFDLTGYRDAGRYRERARKEYLESASGDILIVGIIGRLTSIKNHRMLLDAARNLRERGQGDSFRFLVVGDGELREDLAAYAKNLGVEDSVSFVGWQRDMPRIYGAMDVVALTSRNEGTPVTLIEAMAAGIPVVATSVGGVPDLLGKSGSSAPGGYRAAQRGILVQPGDASALADAFLFIREKREQVRSMSSRARVYALSRYDQERLVKDIAALYSGILKG